MFLQYIIITVVLLASLTYAIALIVKTLKVKKGVCDGCPGCKLSNKSQGGQK